MYSMVMMMAVASSGDSASFGGRKGDCNGCDGGRVGLFQKNSCGGGGLFGGHKDRGASCDGGNGCDGGRGGLFSRGKHGRKGGSCNGYVAPACPEACPAPCGPTDPCAIGGPIVTPHAEQPKVMPKPADPKIEPKTGTTKPKES